jgi:hypothetical protein
MPAALQLTSNATGGTHGDIPAGSILLALCTSSGLRFDATEAKRQITYHEAGTLSQLAARLIASSAGGIRTLFVRLNGVNGNCTITFPASTTGYFEDNTNTDVVADGDEVNYRSRNTGLAVITFTAISTIFTATDAAVTSLRYAAVNFHNLWSTGKDSAALSANVVAASSVEARHQCRMGAGGTLSNLFLRLTTNSRGGVEAGSRINGADGNLFIDTGSTATGVFEDTSNTDVVVGGDLVNYHFDGGSTIGFSDTITMDMLSLEWQSTNNQYHLILSPAGGTAFAGGNDPEYYPGAGGSQGNLGRATEADVQVDLNHAAELRRLAAYSDVSGNQGKVILRQNAADTTLYVDISADGTGIVLNSVDGVVFAAGDDLSIKLTGFAQVFTIVVLVSAPLPTVHLKGLNLLSGKTALAVA